MAVLVTAIVVLNAAETPWRAFSASAREPGGGFGGFGRHAGPKGRKETRHGHTPPMRATLIHNPKAGNGGWSAERLAAALAAAGCAVAAHHPADAPDLDETLAAATGVVAVAGGDGTVARVAKALHGGSAQLAILPSGGANNIACSLGIPADLEAAIRALATARPRRFRIGRLKGGGCDRHFVESVGLGPLAEAAWRMPDEGYAREEKRKRGRAVLREALLEAETIRAAVILDGEPLREAALMLEAMHIARVGPSLELAPGADPGDGLLCVAWLPPERRAAMADWLEAPEAGPPPLCWKSARRVELEIAGSALRVDDDRVKAVGGGVVLDLLERPIAVLSPP